MNCEWVKTNGTLYLYNELADDERFELEQHLNRCGDCTQEMGSLKGLHSLLSAAAVAGPSPNMLAAARMRLQESLESTEQSRGLSRFTIDVAGWFTQMRFSPALAAVLLMIGFGGGALATFKSLGPARKGGADSSVASLDSASSSIAAIRGISQNADNKVEIKYDQLVPGTAQGSLDDPKIQQLLLYAARNNYNSGLRMDSVDLLTRNPQDARVREALIFSLRYDKNPGVRLKALSALSAYVKEDVRVRDVILEVLIRDSNQGVRTEAIRSLQPVTADSSVRQTLEVLAAQDSNKFIRSESQRVLASVREIQ